MDLRLTMIQSKLSWENPQQNRDYLEKKIQLLTGQTDLVILPEMFTTGFSMNAHYLAEPMSGPTVEWLQKQATQLNSVVTGSFICEENGHYYNRLIWMQPDGTYLHYDKRHRFTLAGEHKYYSAGNTRIFPVVKGWKVCPLICYDLRFPVWSRNTNDYDLLIYVANWPEKRSYAWKSLLIGRAIENQCYTVGVNRVGMDENDIYYSGDSTLTDFEGKLLYRISDIEDVFTTTISKEPQHNFRSKLQFLADRDQFTIANDDTVL